jgi:hypothetical protein
MVVECVDLIRYDKFALPEAEQAEIKSIIDSTRVDVVV